MMSFDSYSRAPLTAIETSVKCLPTFSYPQHLHDGRGTQHHEKRFSFLERRIPWVPIAPDNFYRSSRPTCPISVPSTSTTGCSHKSRQDASSSANIAFKPDLDKNRRENDDISIATKRRLQRNSCPTDLVSIHPQEKRILSPTIVMSNGSRVVRPTGFAHTWLACSNERSRVQRGQVLNGSQEDASQRASRATDFVRFPRSADRGFNSRPSKLPDGTFLLRRPRTLLPRARSRQSCP